MSASHVVRTFSNVSRVPSHHQPAPPPPPQPPTMSHHSSEYRQNRLTLASSSPLSPPPPPPHFIGSSHHYQQQSQQQTTTTASTYESAQLIANEAQIDPGLLAHDNPGNCCETVSPLPLDQYKLNVDRNPIVVRRKPQEKVRYSQQIAVRYLKPPCPPKCGDIVVCELPSKQVAPAPALVVRQAPPQPPTPPPLVLREAPPPPPCSIPGRILHVPGKVLPPPARKVVVERLPPVPAKPQQIFIERWLPYCQPTQRVRYQHAKPPCLIPDPKNVVIQWEAPDVEIRREVRNLGVIVTDPCEYIRRYGSTLIRSDHLPDIAHKYSTVEGLQLAAQQHASPMPILEGDIDALKLVDLEQTGLAGGSSMMTNTKTATTSYTSAFHEHISSANTAATTVGPSSISPLRLNTSPRLNLSSTSPEVAAATAAAAAAAAAIGGGGSANIDATSMHIDELYLQRAAAAAAADQQNQHHHSTTHESIVTNSMLNTLSSS